MNNPSDDETPNRMQVNVSDSWRDIMETQAFLRDDPFGWNVESLSRYDNHHLEVYVHDQIDDYEIHEGEMIPNGLLRFMAGRGWYVTSISMGQSPSSDDWIPCISFSRGPEVFDALVNTGIPVEPSGYDWPPLYEGNSEVEKQ